MACDLYTPSNWFTPRSSQDNPTSKYTLGSRVHIAWWGGTPYVINQQQEWSLLLGWFSDNNVGSAVSNGHINEITSTSTFSSFGRCGSKIADFETDPCRSRWVALYIRLRQESTLGDAQCRLQLYYTRDIVVDSNRHRHIVESEVQDLRSTSDRSKCNYHKDQSRLFVVTLPRFINFKQNIKCRELSLKWLASTFQG